MMKVSWRKPYTKTSQHYCLKWAMALLFWVSNEKLSLVDALEN